ncbi:MAG: peptidase S10, partial [Acidimicrobiia bacterium]|nr:peptidase S10 [Acidimicrobiia bacterium]
QQLREYIGVETDRQYHLLSMEVFQAWKVDVERHAFEHHVGATDDLRYGIALNPDLKVFITHGRYDLVTPYYSAERMRNLMRLDEDVASRLTVQHWGGGHMFYAWEESRIAFTAAIREFYSQA